MSKQRDPMCFFTDNDVENSVGDHLLGLGYDVVRLRDVMLQESKDPIVDAACRESGRILITHNSKDFRNIAKALEVSAASVKRLHRIDLQCHQMFGRRRLIDALHLIEAEWHHPEPSKFGLRFEISMEIIRVRR